MANHVVYGSGGEGKSRRAREAAQLLGCTQIFDGLDITNRGELARLPNDGALIITNHDRDTVRKALPSAEIHHAAEIKGRLERAQQRRAR